MLSKVDQGHENLAPFQINGVADMPFITTLHYARGNIMDYVEKTGVGSLGRLSLVCQQPFLEILLHLNTFAGQRCRGWINIPSLYRYRPRQCPSCACHALTVCYLAYDTAQNNIMITSHGRAHITDIALNTVVLRILYATSRPNPTIAVYRAPEEVRYGVAVRNKDTDVYAYASMVFIVSP